MMHRRVGVIRLVIAFQTRYAQPETARESFRIKAKDLAKENQNSSKLFNLSPVRGLTNKDVKITMGIPHIDGFRKEERGITTTKDVVDPTWDIKQKFSENQKDISKYDKDFYLGDIKTKSKYIRLICRDHEYEDGDRIKWLLNTLTIHPNILVRNSPYVSYIYLK